MSDPAPTQPDVLNDRGPEFDPNLPPVSAVGGLLVLIRPGAELPQ